MAIYSLNLGFISRSEGHSAVGFSAYISASYQLDERTGIRHDYVCKEDVIVSRILAPEEAPAWAKNAATLWNHVEAFEDHFATLRFRGDVRNPDKNQKSLEAREHFLNTTQTAQTIMGALPLEFTQLEAEACVEEFLRERFVSRGLVVQYAIHWDEGNPHFHGLITRRALEDGAFAFRKDRDIVTKAELRITRKAWEIVSNKHLALGGHEVRIDCRSYADQGLNLLPARHEGWYAQRLAERGEYSRIVSENEEIRQKNIEILCKNPGALIHEVSLKRTIFTRRHLEEEILRRVGGDEKLFALLQAKVESVEIPPELILKTANHNQNAVFEGGIKNIAAKFTERLLENTDMVAAIGENINREKIFTSASYQQQEEHLLHFGEVLSQRQSKTVSEKLVLKAIEHREEELGFALSEEQKGAISHLCSGPDISILNGKAGTGKTTLLKAVAEAYQGAGYEVLGTSFQGKVVDIMEQEIGIPCRTLDGFIYAWKKHQKAKDLVESGQLWGRPYIYAFNSMKEMEKSRFTEKNVIIVDEANMIGGRLWEPFLKEAVQKGAKVIIVQDPAQIKSRDPGDYGRLFAERYGFTETTEVVRQRVEWQRECSKYLNDHEVLDGLKPYYDKDHLTWFDNREKVITALATSYVKDQLENPDQTCIALAYRNAEVHELNKAIRQALQEHGHLQETFHLHGQEYAIGDRIRFTQNDNYGQFVQNLQKEDKSKGIKNGTFGTIEAYDERSATLTVRLENNRLACNRHVSFNTTAYTKITHGYAMGVHKSEGSTFDKSFLSLDPLLDPHTCLVAMTRHRQDVQVYINREQFVDFKDVVDQISRTSLKETIQDYQITEEQKSYFNRVQQYKDLLVEGVNLREEMEGTLDPKTPFYKHPSYPAYQLCFEEKKRVASTILEDWKAHAPYTRLAGLRKDVLEVEAGLRPRLLSDLEYRASIQVQGYMDLVLQTRMLWKEICQTHPASLSSSHHRHEDYKSLKTERDSLASVFQENQRLYAPFFRSFKDEALGEIKDFWGDVITNDSRVTWAGVKSHADAHFKSQMEKLTYERIPDHQKPHFDVVKDYVQTRNEAAAIYAHIQKQKGIPTQESSPQPTFSLEKFHDLQKRRDALALKIVDAPNHYQPFFETLKIKEDKILIHAVAGELREKVVLYGQEKNPEKRSQQAIELKRILTTSKDYRFLKEGGIDANRLAFDIAFHDKLKTGEIPETLNHKDIYKPIQSYLKASKESAKLWKVLNRKVQDPQVQKQWGAAFQARNENASQLVNNPVALAIISSMRPELSARISKQANWWERDTAVPQDFVKARYSIEHVLQATKGQTLSIASEILGEPNRHMSNKTILRFGKKGSLVVNVSGTHEGLWKDFESGEGGNIIQLVQREKNLTFKESLSYLGERLKVTPEGTHKPSLKAPIQQPPSIEDAKERASRLNSVSELQMKSKQIQGTIAETYLRKERGIQGELSSDLRYLPKGSSFIYQEERKAISHDCLAAFGRTETGSLSSVQLTKLDDQGNRARTSEGEKLTKIQYGLAKGSFVTLQEDKSNTRVFIAEGVETALSLKEAGLKGTIVASLGIHNIANYKGPEKEIILCGDNDDHKENSKTHSILEGTKENFEIQGRSVLIVKPSHPGDDFNDVLKKDNVQGVRAYLRSYLDPEKQMRVQQKIEAQAINNGKQPLAEHSKSTVSHPASASQSIEVISDYIQSKMRDIKTYEGTSLAHEAKDELRSYLSTLQKNDTLLQALKDHDQDLVKEVQKMFQEQQRSKVRSMEI